jgi:hypothetical protein
VTSSWFFLSTLNYDARSAAHQILHIVYDANTEVGGGGHFLIEMSIGFYRLRRLLDRMWRHIDWVSIRRNKKMVGCCCVCEVETDGAWLLDTAA